jgi:predicted Zn-ribbon and HTH transcriptional regulator
MTREDEIGKRMNELQRQYRETRDERIIDELNKLARELKRMKKKESR